ncbi:ribbon-helix-helix DNA binding domain protein [Gordonia phage EdmundFerry]|nr:ribbon-helix-helix DNA binding domain protein [Gordonia phage EdmundFerry]
MSGGTVTRYRCRKCGEVWTWRNTQEGRNEYARQQYRHDGMLEEVPLDEYPGQHRNGEPGLTWWPVMLYRWQVAAHQRGP